jgi:P27 family predicted phage terminase small subunit
MKNPPRGLRKPGRDLWRGVLTEYAITDTAGLELLRTACEAADRLAEARQLLRADGLVVLDRFGQKRVHPAALVERDAASLLARMLRQLDLEAPREEGLPQ